MPRPKIYPKTYVMMMPEEMYSDLKVLSKFTRRSMAEEIRIAIEDRLARVREKQDHESAPVLPVR